MNNHLIVELNNTCSDLLLCPATQELGHAILTVLPENLLKVAHILKDNPAHCFEQLIDVCGVDYLHYGADEWAGDESTATGFERGVDRDNLADKSTWTGKRFEVVYHLLSLKHNQRVRIHVPLDGDPPICPSLVPLWASANWFERETFDLFGILFDGHPDLRRILTDYGFIGHPFRKDFPVSGHVEVRYDAALKRVVYDAVDIEPRVLVPKVIRLDARYAQQKEKTDE